MTKQKTMNSTRKDLSAEAPGIRCMSKLIVNQNQPKMLSIKSLSKGMDR